MINQESVRFHKKWQRIDNNAALGLAMTWGYAYGNIAGAILDLPKSRALPLEIFQHVPSLLGIVSRNLPASSSIAQHAALAITEATGGLIALCGALILKDKAIEHERQVRLSPRP